jgi:hypothetical protein
MFKGKTAFAIAVLVLTSGAQARQRTIDDFFRDFTAEWVRGNPNGATSSRYFSGEEQDRLERQLTPQTATYQRSRIQLARKGLTELVRFDGAAMNETQRVSADLLRGNWRQSPARNRISILTFRCSR